MKKEPLQQRSQTSHIECPSKWDSTNDYDSHKSLLYLALTKTTGSVVEFGCGFGSTPFLKKYCLDNNRDFVSFETDKEWAAKFDGTVVIDSFSKYVNDNIGLLFIDGKPGEERKDRLLQFMPLAQVLIAHDTQPSADYCYKMSEVLPKFKYRLDYTPDYEPHSTAVSNFIDVSKWVNAD